MADEIDPNPELGADEIEQAENMTGLEEVRCFFLTAVHFLTWKFV